MRKVQYWTVLRKCGGHCWYCGLKPDILTDLTVDHAKPQSRRGTNADRNLLPACEYCNKLKDSQTISEFRRTVKNLVIRNMMTMGYLVNLSALRIVFYGEGNRSPLGY